MTDEDQLLRARIRPLGVGPGREDWTDVRRRARAHGYRRIRRRWLVAAVAAVIAALAVGPALGLGGSALDLFRDTEKPALPRESLHPLMRLQFDRKYGEWSLHKVASDGKTAFYALRDGKGNVVCIGSGSEGRPKQPIGSLSCGEQSSLGADRPIYYDLVVEASLRDPTPHPWRIRGVAVDEVETIAIIAGDQQLETVVEENAFTITRFPRSDTGRIEIAALGDDGDVLFREPLRGFGSVPRPPAVLPPAPPPPPQPRLTPLPGEDPLQKGRSEDASVEVYRSGAVVFRMERGSRAARLAGPQFSCVRFTSIDGHDYPVSAGGGAGNLAPTGTRLNGTTRGPSQLVEAPFDGCEVYGSFGRHWNDPRGVRAPVEVPLTAKGRRYFDRRAAARDLALFVRSPRIVEVRRRLKRDPLAVLPAAAVITRRLPARVIALESADEPPAGERIGLWTDGRRLVASRVAAGRRLVIETEDGRIVRHNLGRLTHVF